MATIDEQRQQMIRRVLLRQPALDAGDLTRLWQRLADELTAIIGHAGFYTLYGRAAHLARASHADLPTTAEAGFAALQAYLAALTPARAAAANLALLTILIDTLAKLIGDPLTAAILDSAWGADTDTAGKDTQ